MSRPRPCSGTSSTPTSPRRAVQRLHLDLPHDRYTPNIDLSVLTAGAVAVAAQVPLPNSLSGVVYVDQNLNNQQDAGDHGIGGVNLTLYRLDDGQYVSTGRTTVTDTQGNYQFDQLLPRHYPRRRDAAAGLLQRRAQRPGRSTARSAASSTTADILSDDRAAGRRQQRPQRLCRVPAQLDQRLRGR